MPLNKGKHIVDEINGVRCTIVETGVSASRCEFLRGLLSINRMEVKIKPETVAEGQEPKFTIGVTSIVFNPVIAVYEKLLRTANGRLVTPAYWNQASADTQVPYWLVQNSNLDSIDKYYSTNENY